MTERTSLQREALGLMRLTIEQIDFAADLDNFWGASFPNVHPYFLQMSDAVDRDDPADFGKFCALLIIEISQRGQSVAGEATNWICLFGNLPDFALLTQLPSVV